MRKNSDVVTILQIVLVLALVPARLHAASTGGPHFSPNEVVCRVLLGSTIEEINATYGTQVKGHISATDVYLLNIPPGQNPDSLALLIDADPRVDFCRPNYYLAAPEGFQRSSPFVDAELIGTIEDQPAAVTLGVADATQIATGAGVRIALIDGGVAYTHPVFSLTSGEVVSRWDYLENDSLAQAEPVGSCASHGTFLAALLQLVAPGADIYVYKTLDTAGQGNAFTITAAVLQAIDDSCDVINLSLGMPGTDDALDEALRIARQSGLSVVAAAGNDSTNLNSIFPFPASRTYATAVAALDSVNTKADFSNYGVRVDLCAPGTRIYSAFGDSLYAWWDGTSFAAPMVTGLIALVTEMNPDLTPEQIDTILARSAVNVDSINPSFAGELGAGLINPVAALQLAAPVSYGDVTADGALNVLDLTTLVSYLFRGFTLDVLANPDASCDGKVNVVDLTVLVTHLFHGAPMPCPAI